MKILCINPNTDGYGKINIGFTMVMNVLQEAGHEILLFDPTFIVVEDHQDEKVRKDAGFVDPIDIAWMYDYKPREEIDDMLRWRIDHFKPDLALCTIVEENYEYADHLLGICKEFWLTTMVGGCTPSCAPEVIIENPNIDYVCQGEGELAMVDFLADVSLSVINVDGGSFWWKRRGIIHSPTRPRPFIDMNQLPMQNLDMWDDKHHYKPFLSKLRRNITIEMSRGCPYGWCNYCHNSTQRSNQKECGKWHREKSLDNVFREMHYLIEKHDMNLVFFVDDDFLVMGKPRWAEFVRRYKEEINLPFWMNTELDSINERNSNDLTEIGCAGVGIGLESGSEWIRSNVLNRKYVSNAEMTRRFKIIDDAGIRLTLNTMIGIPGEHEDDIFESIKFLRALKPKSIDCNYLTPFIGTPIHKTALKHGLFEAQTRPGFRGMVKNPRMRKHPSMDMPWISQETLKDIYYKFSDYVYEKIPIPAQFEKPAPGSTLDIPRDDGREIITVDSLCPKPT